MDTDTPPPSKTHPHRQLQPQPQQKQRSESRESAAAHIAIKRQLGKGHNAVVYLVEYNTDPTPRAMKKIPRNNKRTENMNRLRANNPARAGAGAASSNANAKGLPRTTPAPTALVDRRGTEEAKIRREIAIMKKCDHPNIIKFYSFIDDQMSANVCLIMEYMEGGELQWQSKSEQGGPYLTMDQTRRCTRDVVLGLQYLHTQGIIHRDIKPSNIMWTADRSHVKIGDFGVAHLVSPPPSLTSLALPPGVDGETQTQEEMDWEGPRHAGTPAFLAPEIAPGGESSTSTSPTSPASSSTAQRREAVTPAVDLWALGITLFCMLFGRLPFAPSAAAAASGPVGAEAGLYRAIREEEWWAGLGLPQHLLPPSSRSSSVLPPLPPSSSSSHSSRAGDGDGEGEREPTTTMCANRVPIKTADWERTGVLGLLNGLLQKDVGRRWGIGEVKDVPWLLTDIQRRQEWRAGTTPRIEVSAADEANAILEPRYKWHFLGRRFSNLFARARSRDGLGAGRDGEEGERRSRGGAGGESSSNGRRTRNRDRDREDDGTGAVRSLPSMSVRVRTSREKEKARADDALFTLTVGKGKGKEKTKKKSRARSVDAPPPLPVPLPGEKQRRGSESVGTGTVRPLIPSPLPHQQQHPSSSTQQLPSPLPPLSAGSTGTAGKKAGRSFFRWGRDSPTPSVAPTTTSRRLGGVFRTRPAAAARHSTEALGSAPMVPLAGVQRLSRLGGGASTGGGGVDAAAAGIGAEQRTASLTNTGALVVAGRVSDSTADWDLFEEDGEGRGGVAGKGMIAAPRPTKVVYVDEREKYAEGQRSPGSSSTGSASGCSYGSGARVREGWRDEDPYADEGYREEGQEEEDDEDDDGPRGDVYENTSSGDEGEEGAPIEFKGARGRVRGAFSSVTSSPVNGRGPHGGREEGPPESESEGEEEDDTRPAADGPGHKHGL